MTRRRLLLALGLVAGAALIGYSVLCYPRPASFTESMARQIKGMTQAEVVAILGRPAGRYASPDADFPWACSDYLSDAWFYPEGCQRPDGGIDRAWISDEGAVEVDFDREGRATRWEWEPMCRPPRQSFFDRMRELIQRFFR